MNSQSGGLLERVWPRRYLWQHIGHLCPRSDIFDLSLALLYQDRTF